MCYGRDFWNDNGHPIKLEKSLGTSASKCVEFTRLNLSDYQLELATMGGGLSRHISSEILRRLARPSPSFWSAGPRLVLLATVRPVRGPWKPAGAAQWRCVGRAWQNLASLLPSRAWVPRGDSIVPLLDTSPTVGTIATRRVWRLRSLTCSRKGIALNLR